jgi:cellulose synthase (UDP-forming)
MKKEDIGRSLLLYATAISMTAYILWRILFTVPMRYGLVSLIVGSLLIASEASSALEALLIYFQRKMLKPIKLPDIPPSWYPDVDILIATHNESTDLLYKTANACTYLDYPDKSRLHAYICDDTDRPGMAGLAKKLGVGYFGLSRNRHAKAGNLNNALSQTSSPIVAIVDADMILRSDFLMRTIPYFFLTRVKMTPDGRWEERDASEIDQDDKVGFIQTPQSFYNPDLFQYNLFSEKRVPNEQDYFFREINVIRNAANAPVFAGTNAVISRKALEEVGYISTGTITEDFETGLKIQLKGYKTYAVNETLAQGLAPTSLKSLLSQRERWGRGCVQSLRNVRFLSDRKFPLLSKLSYVATFLYWWTFFRRFVYILSPILFSLFSIVIVDADFWNLLMFWLPSYLLYNRTLREISGNIRNQHWSNVVDVILFPYMMFPILKETLGIKQGKFVVTKKDKEASQKNSKFLIALPHIILLATSIMAIFACIGKYLESGSMIYNLIVMFWLVINTKDLMFAVFFMHGRERFRNHERFYVNLPVRIEYGGRTIYGMTSDISEGGMSVVLKRPEYLPSDEDFAASVGYKGYRGNMSCTVAHVVALRGREWKYCVRITEIDESNKREFFQIIYDRRHTLPTRLDLSWGLFEDFSLNLNDRTKPIQQSMRKLPRMNLNAPFNAGHGVSGAIMDFNYQYAVVNADCLPSPNANFLRRLAIPLSDKIVMKLEIVEGATRSAPGRLYVVLNWKALATDPAFGKIIDSWLECGVAGKSDGSSGFKQGLEKLQATGGALK